MIKQSILLMLLSCISLFVNTQWVLCGIRSASDPLTEQLARADRQFDQGRYTTARKIVEQAFSTNPQNAEILWRLAYYAINDGDGSSDATARERHYRQAIEYAEMAVQSDARNAFARACLAAAYGSIGMFVGGKEKVRLANRIRDELNESLKIDLRNQMAHTIFGTWHREVATVGWVERQLANIFLGSMPDGSLEKSISHFKSAIAEGPTVLRHHYELGLTYIAAGRKKDAAASFRTALACKDSWKKDPDRRRRMKEWLAEQ